MQHSTEAQQEQVLRRELESILAAYEEKAQIVRTRSKAAYPYDTECQPLQSRGLHFEAILNAGRYDYVRKQFDSPPLEEKPCAICGNKPCPFCEPEPCPFCTPILSRINEEVQCALIHRISFDLKEYGLIINTRPWGRNHCMLVTLAHMAQTMTEQELLAGFRLLQMLGPDYEGIFTGEGAGASVPHFHLQIHLGAAAIWRNIEEGRAQLIPFDSLSGTAAYRIQGWPSCAFVFESSDAERLVSAVYRMLETLDAHKNPYNLGFHCHDERIRLILFPRHPNPSQSKKITTPSYLNGYADSWGQFAFMEMAGSVFVLTPEGHKATTAEGIYDAISEMSIPQDEMEVLIAEFREAVAASPV